MKSLLNYIKEDIFSTNDNSRLAINRPVFFGGEIKGIKNGVCEFDSPNRNSVIVDLKTSLDGLQEIINAFKIHTFRYTQKNSLLDIELVDKNDFKNMNFECIKCGFIINDPQSYVHNLNIKSDKYISYTTYKKQKYNTIFENCDFECSDFLIEGSSPTFYKSNLKFEKITAESKRFHQFVRDVIYNYKDKSQVDMGKSLFFGANLECKLIDSEYRGERIILSTTQDPKYIELGSTGWYFTYL